MTVAAQPDYFKSPYSTVNRKLETIIKSYEEQGYEISRAPSFPNDLPAFLADFHPDAVATREGEHVVIEIKSPVKPHSNDHDYWFNLATVIKEHQAQGWQLRVLTDFEPVVEEDISLVDIENQLRQAIECLHKGLVTHAVLLTWPALEAAMRSAAHTNRVEISDYSAQRLISNLYAEGFLERDEYDLLVKNLNIRYSAAHGFRSQADPAEIERLCKIARRLIRQDGDE